MAKNNEAFNGWIVPAFSYDVDKDSLLKGCLVEYVNQAEYLATVVKDSYAINYENQKYWFSFSICGISII